LGEEPLHVSRASVSRASGHGRGHARRLDLKNPAILHHVSLEPVLDLALVDPPFLPVLADRCTDPGDAEAAEALPHGLVVVAWTQRPAHWTDPRRVWGTTPFDARYIRAEHRDGAAAGAQVDVPVVHPSTP